MADGGSDRQPDGLPVLGLRCHAGRLFADGRGAERPRRDRQPAGGQSGLYGAAGAGYPHRCHRGQPARHRRAARQYAGLGGKLRHRLRPRHRHHQHHRLQLVRRRQPEPRQTRQRFLHPELREHLRPQLADEGQQHDHARHRAGGYHPDRRRLDHEERLVPHRRFGGRICRSRRAGHPGDLAAHRHLRQPPPPDHCRHPGQRPDRQGLRL